MNILRMALLSVAFTLGASFAPVVSAQQPAAQKSLYDRLGGPKGITVVVDDFINRLVANKELNKNPAIDAGRNHSPKNHRIGGDRERFAYLARYSISRQLRQRCGEDRPPDESEKREYTIEE